MRVIQNVIYEWGDAKSEGQRPCAHWPITVKLNSFFWANRGTMFPSWMGDWPTGRFVGSYTC